MNDIQDEAEKSVSAGRMLREARVATGLHIGVLSSMLKVSVKKLEALEADDWSQLPDMIFVRALATSVCRQVKIDSAPVLAALPSLQPQKLPEPPAVKAVMKMPFSISVHSKWVDLRQHLSSPMLIATSAVLLAAVLVLFLPDLIKQPSDKNVDIVEKMEPAPEQTPMQVPMETLTPSTKMPLVSTSPTTPIVITMNPATSTASTTPAPTGSGSATLRMVAKGEVWVEVKDAKDVFLVRRTLKPKEVVRIVGQPPMAVVIGRIDEMESVEARGKPMSLDGISPDNVARFEVK